MRLPAAGPLLSGTSGQDLKDNSANEHTGSMGVPSPTAVPPPRVSMVLNLLQRVT